MKTKPPSSTKPPAKSPAGRKPGRTKAPAKSRAGRKPGRTKAKLSLTINTLLVDRANQVAFKNQEALSSLVERALRKFIEAES